MKTLLKIIAGLVVVVAIVAVIGIMNLDKGIKAAVETLGPEYTKADVTLATVDLSLQSGKGSLGGLVVGNPAGFKTDQAFSLGEILVDIDTDTLTSDVIVIETIRILKPEITYETGKKGSNIEQLQKNVASAAGGEGGSGGASSGTAGEDTAPVKLIIKDLQISGGEIHYSNALLGGKTIDVELPDIRLANIGKKSGGATGAEVVKQILDAINKQARSAIAGSDSVDQLKDQLEGKLKGDVEKAVGDKLKGFLNRD